MPLNRWVTTTFYLGIVVAIAFPLSALALQDIWHREADLRLEFWIVRISFLLIALFIAATLRTLTIVRRGARDTSSAN